MRIWLDGHGGVLEATDHDARGVRLTLTVPPGATPSFEALLAASRLRHLLERGQRVVRDVPS